jgi:hypothetical protein
MKEEWDVFRNKYELEREKRFRKMVLRIYEMIDKNDTKYTIDPFGKTTHADPAARFFHGELTHLKNYLSDDSINKFCEEKNISNKEEIKRFATWVIESALFSQIEKEEKEFKRVTSPSKE